MAIGEVIGDGNPTGTNFGRAADKIGFYGLATPIVKPTTTFTSTATCTVASTVATDLHALRTTLAALGLLTSA
jgi:hypothetical protein